MVIKNIGSGKKGNKNNFNILPASPRPESHLNFQTISHNHQNPLPINCRTVYDKLNTPITKHLEKHARPKTSKIIQLLD